MPCIDIQLAALTNEVPDKEALKTWCRGALLSENTDAELTLRVVNRDEIQALNLRYRNKDKPTNVLSFPSEIPTELRAECNLLGDIVICPDIVNSEACEQSKTNSAHWAHMVVHGTLHLQGFDHETGADAEVMERKETEILASFGFPNPYQ